MQSISTIILILSVFPNLIGASSKISECSLGEVTCNGECLSLMVSQQCSGPNQTTPGECFKTQSLCDGVNDCSGLFDESVGVCHSRKWEEDFCHNSVKDGLHYSDVFECHHFGCVPSLAVCDGNIDCIDGTDESTNCPDHLLLCDASSNLCRVPWIDGSTKQLCNEGYTMVDGLCVDRDECKDDVCPQSCSNLIGSKTCTCPVGFEHRRASVDGNKYEECVAVVGSDSLLITVQYKQNMHYFKINNEQFTGYSSDGEVIQSMDVDWENQRLFWSTYSSINIIYFPKSATSANSQTSLFSQSKGLMKIMSIAYDWMGRNIYALDAMSKSLIVINVQSGHMIELLDLGEGVPNKIAVAPTHNLVLWTQTYRIGNSNYVFLMSATMDGIQESHMKDICNFRVDGDLLNTDLSIDVRLNKAYVSINNGVRSCNFDGTQRTELEPFIFKSDDQKANGPILSIAKDMNGLVWVNSINEVFFVPRAFEKSLPSMKSVTKLLDSSVETIAVHYSTKIDQPVCVYSFYFQSSSCKIHVLTQL